MQTSVDSSDFVVLCRKGTERPMAVIRRVLAGKPCAGKPHARFDEGGLAKAATARLVRHRQMKEAEADRPGLTSQQPALYSILNHVFYPSSLSMKALGRWDTS